MPRKRYYKNSNGWKRRTASGGKMRKWAVKRMAQPKLSGLTAPINLGKGIPTALRTALTWSKNIVVGGSLGLASDYVFRGNDLYDPDFTGTGTQPLFFDQFIAMYSFYSVRSSNITIDFANDTAEALVCCILPYKNSSYAFSGSNYPNVLQLPGCKYITLAPKGSGKDVATLSNFCTTNTFFPDYSESADDFRGFANNSVPSPGAWFWHVFCYPASLGSTTITASANVRVTYYNTFFTPNVTVFS